MSKSDLRDLAGVISGCIVSLASLWFAYLTARLKKPVERAMRDVARVREQTNGLMKQMESQARAVGFAAGRRPIIKRQRKVPAPPRRR